MRKSILLFVILVACFAASGCKIGQEAGGRETDVIVVAGEEDWQEAGAAVEEAFSEREKMLDQQKIFDLIRVDEQDLELYRYRKNLLLVSRLDSDLVKDVLAEDARVTVRSGESYMFGSLGAWIPEQILVVIVAPPDKSLEEVAKMTAPSAFKFFKDECLERIRRRIYRQGENQKLRALVEGKYGWTIDVPNGYEIADDDSAAGVVSLIRHNPERSLVVFWGFPKDDKSWADLRDEMAALYLQGDEVVRKTVSERATDFGGYEAKVLSGQWENERKLIGGPFVTYCFQDTSSGEYYMIDYNVFAPAEKKWPILGQLEWIARTFRIVRQQ
jgi:hypothetical protein